VVILGTGWAGASFLRNIDTSLYDVHVVSPRNYFTFTPLLPSVTCGTVEARSIVEPIRNIVRKVCPYSLVFLFCFFARKKRALFTTQQSHYIPERLTVPHTGKRSCYNAAFEVRFASCTSSWLWATPFCSLVECFTASFGKSVSHAYRWLNGLARSNLARLTNRAVPIEPTCRGSDPDRWLNGLARSNPARLTNRAVPIEPTCRGSDPGTTPSAKNV
jgi:hypothetical protein